VLANVLDLDYNGSMTNTPSAPKRHRVVRTDTAYRTEFDFGDVIVELDEQRWTHHREVRQVRVERQCGRDCQQGGLIAKGDVALVEWEGYAPTAEDTGYSHPECAEAQERKYNLRPTIAVVRA
jgi:hypothetical protein